MTSKAETVSSRIDMAVGQTWVYRARAFDPDCPIVKAELLQFGPKPHKVRVRWLEGEYNGLDEWVPRVRLRVLWAEKDAWLQNESALYAAMDASEGANENLWYHAAEAVFAAYPRRRIWLNCPRGNLLCIFEPQSIADDLGIDMSWLLTQPLSFVNLEGEYVAPAQVAEPLARLIAEKRSAHVLDEVQREESEQRERAVTGRYTEQGHVPPERYLERLRESEPVLALVREWCGGAAQSRFDEVVALRAENVRLRKMVADAAERIKESGHPQVAARLRRALGMPP